MPFSRLIDKEGILIDMFSVHIVFLFCTKKTNKDKIEGKIK